MSRSALTAPAHVVIQRKASGQANNSPDACPSLSYGGSGILDDRLPWNLNNSSTGAQAIGWYGDSPITYNGVPTTLADNNIAASQAVTAGTAMTLVSASGSGITVLSATFLAKGSFTVIPKNALVMEANPNYIAFGTRDYTNFYDHTTMLARNVRVTTNNDDTGGFYTVAGYDVYGYAMTEKITGVNNAVASGKKAFKWITSVTPSGTLNSTLVKVGNGDVIGLNLRADQFGYVFIIYAGTTVTSNTGFVAADTTTPATNVTGDVRGTYALQSASNSSRRLEISVFPNIAGFGTTPAGVTTGLWGVTQA